MALKFGLADNWPGFPGILCRFCTGFCTKFDNRTSGLQRKTKALLNPGGGKHSVSGTNCAVALRKIIQMQVLVRKSVDCEGWNRRLSALRLPRRALSTATMARFFENVRDGGLARRLSFLSARRG